MLFHAVDTIPCVRECRCCRRCRRCHRCCCSHCNVACSHRSRRRSRRPGRRSPGPLHLTWPLRPLSHPPLPACREEGAVGDEVDRQQQLLCGAAGGVCLRGGHPLLRLLLLHLLAQEAAAHARWVGWAQRQRLLVGVAVGGGATMLAGRTALGALQPSYHLLRCCSPAARPSALAGSTGCRSSATPPAHAALAAPGPPPRPPSLPQASLLATR